MCEGPLPRQMQTGHGMYSTDTLPVFEFTAMTVLLEYFDLF